MRRNILPIKLEFPFKIALFFLLFTFGSFTQILGQTNGDYRSKQTGNWSANTTWEKYTTQWADALPGDYPGKSSTAGNVTIQKGFTVTVDVINVVCSSIQLGVFKQNDGILKFNSGSILTVTGNVILGDGSQGNHAVGSIIMTNGGLLQIGGLLTAPFLGTWTPGTGTIEYNGTAQTVYANNYNNLILSGSGTKTLQTGTTNINGNFTFSGSASATAVIGLNIGGDFVLGSGTTFSGGTFNHTMSGNWTNNGGTFNSGTGTITMNGVAKTIGGSASTTFNNLTLGNGTSTTVTLGNSQTVNGTLNLNNVQLKLLSYNLTLGASAPAVNGSFWTGNMVVADGTGQLQKIFASNGSYLFPIGDVTSGDNYSPITLNFTSGTYGANAYVGVRVTDAKHPNNTSVYNYLTRYWTVSQSGISTFSCDVAGTYIYSDDVVGQEYLQNAAEYSGSTWSTFSALGSNTLNTNGVTVFGDFTGIGVPTITSSVASLSGFTYVSGSGPSSSQNFTVYGVNLTQNVTVAAPTDYEVSTSSNSGYQSSLTLTPSGGVVNYVTVFVRLKAGLAAGSYSENVVVSSTGATSKNISLSGTVTGSSLTITTGTISPASYCQGSAVSVPYNITGTFTSGNIFTAQLSDASGSFASSTDIGTLSSTTAGTISATIPGGQAAGTGYRIRVVSSNPAVTGSDNGSNISILSAPTITGTSPGAICGTGSVTISATASSGTINWYAAATGGSSLGTGSNYTTPSISSTTTYYVDATNGSCTSSPRVAVVAAIITPPTITASGGGTFCSGTDINLTSSSSNITNQYWTGPNSFYSLSQNPTITGATTANSGTYTVTGSALSGVNLVSNGDFESGNTGFGSSYAYKDSTCTTCGTWGPLSVEATYSVVANPHNVHTNFSACPDHSSPGNLQMVINGAGTANVSVWNQTVNVVTGTDYQFTYWIQSVYSGSPSQLQLYINGSPAGPVYTADLATCSFRQFTYNWNSGSSTTADLSLVNQNTATGGNDFALDDIVFQQACTATSSVVVTVNAAVTAGAIGNAQTICSGNTPAAITSVTDGTGDGTIAYEWQTNASGSYVTIPGATAATYSPPALTATTSYQRRTVSVSGGTTCYSPYTTPVTITITSPFAIAGGPDAVCESASPSAITLSGASVGGGATTGAWSIISGGGSLSSTAQTATPATETYTPAANFSGTAVLRLTTNVVGSCSAISDRIINITPVATAVAGTAISTCSNSGGVNITAGSSATNYSAIAWTSSGTGSFTDANSLTLATYTPSVADISAGSVTLTLTATGNSPCGNAVSAKTLTITALPSATISYSGSPFCMSLGTAQSVTRTGTAGGTYSASPAGLSLNASTGAITPNLSTAGAYTVTYTIAASGGCGIVTATTSVTITAVPTATISYTGTPFCQTVATAQPVTLTGTGAYTGGAFSSTSGLTINSSTGAITPSTSTAGTYTVTYTIPASGGCSTVPVTTTVTITALPVATFSYTGSPYCSNASNPSPTFSGGGVAGTFSSTAGLVFVSTATGQINLAASTPGTYTVTNTIAAAGGCSQVTAISNITITALPTATISYSGTPFCKLVSSPQSVSLSGTGAYTGGSYSATPSGLDLNSATGTITPSTSAAGTYTVTYTIPASGGCATVPVTTSVTITAVPTATISYSGTPFCISVSSPQSVSLSGTGAYSGGTYSASPSGLSINSSTGAITPSTSTAGTYTVTYTIPASGGCSSVPATTSVTVNPLSVGGSVSGGTTICSGSTSGTLTLSGQTGTVTKWQSSTDGTNWSDITNTSTSYTSGALTQTMQFRAVVQSGVCSSTNSSATTVTVNQKSADPTSATAGSSTICNGGSTTLTLNGGGGGTSEVIKWYSGSCGGTLVGTGNGLSVSPTTTTTYYGRYEDGAPCNYNSACSSVTITVDPVSVGGTVSGGTTICSGSTSGTLTLSGQTGTVTKWQSSTDGTNWSDITNTSTSYTSGALTQTTQFRAVVQSGVCSLANSLATVVTVDPTSVAGTATPALSQVCYNSGTTITLTGSVGAIQWQTNASGSWADIPGETGNTYTTPNLITGTSYRARVTSGTCSTVYSNTVAITIDNVPPTFSGCPSPITQNVDAGVCSALVSWTVPSATDNCGGTPTVVRSSTSGVTFVDATHATVTVGTSTITYTATDAAGNQGTCSFTVTVTDNIAPTITCPSGATVFCVANAPTYSTLTDFTNAGGSASDNCNLNASSFTKLADNISGSTLTRTYQISDVAGNTSSCSQVFTISQPSVTISSLNTTNTCIGSTLSISSDNTGQNYQWQVSSDNGSSWTPTGTNSPSYSGTLAHQGDQYRLLVSQTTDFSGVGCVATSNVLTFREDTPPAFIIGTLGDQTVCTANGATSAAVYGISLTNVNVADNCTSFANLIKSYTLTGVLTGSGTNLAEGTVFPLGATTVTYTVTDEAGKFATHSFIVTVNQSAAAITLSSAVVSGGGTGTAPHQCGDYNYFVTEDASAPQAGYSYTWKIFNGSGTGGAQLSAGTDYLIDNSTSPYHAASVKISWEGSLMPGTYTIEVTKTGANGCDTKATLEISLQNSFNLTVNDPGQDCKGESLGTKIIDWQVSRTCGTNSYSFSYVIAAGQYTTLADAQAHAISGMPVTVTNTTNNPFIIYQTVDYGTGGDFYTTQIFTLFIYNQLDGNGQPDMNAADDYQYFFLKAIPNTSAITTN